VAGEDRLSAGSDFRPNLSALEHYARAKDYAGFCKFDGLNSPLLEAAALDNRILRLVYTQAVNRIPLPLRSVLGVRKTRNPKGIANFVRGYALLAANPGACPEVREPVRLARELADWLLENDSRSHGQYTGPGRAWGYSFPWQSPAFYAPRYFPNCVVSTFCAEALLDAFSVTRDERYLAAARDASRYLLECLPVLEETEDKLCIGYVHAELRWKVINVNAVAAGFLSRLAKATGESRLSGAASRMIRWVSDAKDPGEALWNYTWPKEQSGIGPDNYHTGGVLDGIRDYMQSAGDPGPEPVFRQALEAYESLFFTPEGGPKWRVDRVYPLDIHGAAQGILTFTRAGALDRKYLEPAFRIARWTCEQMQDPVTGRFYYQKWGGFTWKIDLMRWNNSWMFHALARLVTEGKIT
jgi:hypothetical protein